MYALHDRYYAGCDARTFREDLAGKCHVIVLSEQGALRGFSTVALQSIETDAGTETAIFSGDTIIDHRYWGEQALARMFCRYAGTVKAAQPGSRLYWFLISKGYRTYRYLHAFARDFFPRSGHPTPPPMRQRMDALAQARFGPAYLSDLGIVRFRPVRGFLREPWSGVREGLRTRPEVEFFLRRNAGYLEGDELVCIAELSPENLRSVARREFVQAIADAGHEHQA